MISVHESFIIWDALLHVEICDHPFFLPTRIQYFMNYRLNEKIYFYGLGEGGENIQAAGIPLGNIKLILN